MLLFYFLFWCTIVLPAAESEEIPDGMAESGTLYTADMAGISDTGIAEQGLYTGTDMSVTGQFMEVKLFHGKVNSLLSLTSCNLTNDNFDVFQGDPMAESGFLDDSFDVEAGMPGFHSNSMLQGQSGAKVN